MSRRSAWLQAAPLSAVFVVFFLVPLGLIAMVSFWQATDYELIPAFSAQSYLDIVAGCGGGDGSCVTLSTYLSTLKFSLLTWAITALIGFAVAYFLAFHVRSTLMQTVLFILCTVPFWTSNVIRMISWIPLLGRNGLVNDVLQRGGAIEQPIEWLLFSDFSVVLAFVHLYTMFMIVPLARTGILIGSIFVITIVMGDFVTIGVMGGQQIASVGKIIQVQTSYLQFPLAAANAMILLAVVLMIIWGLTRLVDIRKEL